MCRREARDLWLARISPRFRFATHFIRCFRLALQTSCVGPLSVYGYIQVFARNYKTQCVTSTTYEMSPLFRKRKTLQISYFSTTHTHSTKAPQKTLSLDTK